MPEKFKSLSEIIYKETAFKKIVNKAKEQEVVDKFADIFPELKNVARAVRFEKKTLYLKVENSVWRSELNLKQEAIKKKIENIIEQIKIEKIKFIS